MIRSQTRALEESWGSYLSRRHSGAWSEWLHFHKLIRSKLGMSANALSARLLTSPYLYLWAGSWYLHQSSWLNPTKITNCRNGPSSNGCRGGMLWNHLKRLFLAVHPTHFTILSFWGNVCKIKLKILKFQLYLTNFQVIQHVKFIITNKLGQIEQISNLQDRYSIHKKRLR